MIERFNQVIARGLAILSEEHQRDWDVHLPSLLFAYRTAKHSTRGMSPFALNFGRKPLFPVDLPYVENLVSSVDQDHYMHQLLPILNTYKQLAKHNILHYQQQITKDNKTELSKRFEVGELVLFKDYSRRRAMSPKLRPTWTGPYKISSSDHPNYGISNDQCDLKIVHFNQLRKYHSPMGNKGKLPEPDYQLNKLFDDSAPSPPLPEGYYHIEKLVSITGKKPKRRILVKWVGFKKPTWEPEEEIPETLIDDFCSKCPKRR